MASKTLPRRTGCGRKSSAGSGSGSKRRSLQLKIAVLDEEAIERGQDRDAEDRENPVEGDFNDDAHDDSADAEVRQQCLHRDEEEDGANACQKVENKQQKDWKIVPAGRSPGIAQRKIAAPDGNGRELDGKPEKQRPGDGHAKDEGGGNAQGRRVGEHGQDAQWYGENNQHRKDR